ncbi:hypothetical protein MKX01_037152 [Papaver californicum]|nr:hypothetical protein MKX01_037152 [Papaver californicum]
MEAACTSNLQKCSWIAPQKIRQKPSGFLELPRRWREDRKQRMMLSPRSTKGNSALEPGRTHTFVDEPKILKKKAQEVAPYLKWTLHISSCEVCNAGMMASGKTTIAKTLSKVLGYSFFDSDKLVEQAVGMTSVTQIFKEHSETFLRDNELSLMRQVVVATGGGAVIRPINWKYMKPGITVWLDVPLEALATRIAAEGTDSRPLLHHELGDAFALLSTLSKERGHGYTNADARVSLECMHSEQHMLMISFLFPSNSCIGPNWVMETCADSQQRMSQLRYSSITLALVPSAYGHRSAGGLLFFIDAICIADSKKSTLLQALVQMKNFLLRTDEDDDNDVEVTTAWNI